MLLDKSIKFSARNIEIDNLVRQEFDRHEEPLNAPYAHIRNRIFILPPMVGWLSPSRSIALNSADLEEITAMASLISESVINSMNQFFNRHDILKGIWYPDEYEKYLMDEFGMEMDASFHSGFANEQFFKKTGRFTFQLQDGKKASEALLSFLNGPTIADCGNATMACYYKSILDILGEEKFDQLFSSKPFALMIGQNGITDTQSPISYLADYTEASKQGNIGMLGKRPLQIGEECYFAGIIWYGNKHPVGFSGGWNVIYTGDNEDGEQLFVAHGFEKPLTENEINQKLLENYNEERTLQDEQYIEKQNNPNLYDKNINPYLKSHYTIANKALEKNSSTFIKGFLIGSGRGLQAVSLLSLKNADNIGECMLNLICKKLASPRMP